jgi:hypothetical protein
MQERGGEGVDVRLQKWICYDSKQLPKMKTNPFLLSDTGDFKA